MSDIRQTRFQFENISNEVHLVDGSSRCVLHNVYGKVSASKLLAIMGLSGSGKSTLLQVLGGKHNDNCHTTGVVSFDGQRVLNSMHVPYVWQDDAFFPSTVHTVRDELMFTAFVRMPKSTLYKNMNSAISCVMDKMRLQGCADTSLMYASGGERRRTSIAKELLCDPQLLLLDEATSGLDSAAAFTLLTLLRELAVQRNIPVICTIHQPSTRAFYLFDTVLMLCEGYCVYRGSPSESMSYLAAAGFPPPSADQSSCWYNPADFWMDLLHAQEVDCATGTWPRYVLMRVWWAREQELLELDYYCTSSGTEADTQVAAAGEEDSLLLPTVKSTHDEVNASAEQSMEEGRNSGTIVTSKRRSIAIERGGSLVRHVYAVLMRSARASWSVQFGLISLLQTVTMALLVGACWYQVPVTEARVGDLAGWGFFVAAYWFFAGLYEGMLEYLPERAVLRRELQAGDYSLWACFVGKSIAIMPGQMMLPGLFLVVAYPLMAVHPSLGTYLALWGTCVVATLTGGAMGVVVGTVTTSYHVAASLATVLSLGMLIVGGFYLKQLPPWLSTLGTLCAFRYAYRAAVQVLLLTSATEVGAGVGLGVGVRAAVGVECAGGYWVLACVGREYITEAEAVEALLGTGVESMQANVTALLLFWIIFRVLACMVLHWSEHRTCS